MNKFFKIGSNVKANCDSGWSFSDSTARIISIVPCSCKCPMETKFGNFICENKITLNKEIIRGYYKDTCLCFGNGRKFLLKPTGQQTFVLNSDGTYKIKSEKIKE